MKSFCCHNVTRHFPFHSASVRYPHDRNILLYQTTMAYLSASANYNVTNSTGYRMAICVSLCVLYMFHMLNELNSPMLGTRRKIENSARRGQRKKKKNGRNMKSPLFTKSLKSFHPRSNRRSQIFVAQILSRRRKKKQNE